MGAVCVPRGMCLFTGQGHSARSMPTLAARVRMAVLRLCRRGSPGRLSARLWERPCLLHRLRIRSVAAGTRPTPPRTEEIIAVMRCCGDGRHGDRARGLIVVLWRAGLRIQEALD